MQFDIWTQSLLTAMNTLWGKLAGFIPNLLGALVVVLLGFVIAKLLDALLSKLLAKLGLDRLMGGTGLTKLLARVGIQVPVSTLVGKIVYWFVLLVFLVSAAESLGLQRVSATLDVLALYLPKVFGAALVLIVGVLLAQLVNSVVRARRTASDSNTRTAWGGSPSGWSSSSASRWRWGSSRSRPTCSTTSSPSS